MTMKKRPKLKIALAIVGVLVLIGAAIHVTYEGELNLKQTIYIDVPRDELWQITGVDFAGLDKWIAGVNKSTGEGEGLNGSRYGARVCDPSYEWVKGTVTEKLIEYDPANYRLKYEGVDNGSMPGMKGGSNEWTHEVSGNGTIMGMNGTMQLEGLMGFIMKHTMQGMMKSTLNESLEELKYYAETGQQHPRKVEAMRKYREELAAQGQ